jgi:hypothetical protein
MGVSVNWAQKKKGKKYIIYITQTAEGERASGGWKLPFNHLEEKNDQRKKNEIK